MSTTTRNVIGTNGGKVHAGTAYLAEKHGHAFPMCRTGGQDSGRTRYVFTDQAVTCSRCAIYVTAEEQPADLGEVAEPADNKIPAQSVPAARKARTAPERHVHAPASAVHHNANGGSWTICACGTKVYRGADDAPWTDAETVIRESAAIQPTKTMRSVRVPDHIWQAAAARAESEGTTVSAVIVRALLDYGRDALPAK